MGHDRRAGRNNHRESHDGQDGVSRVRPEQPDDHQCDSASEPEDRCGEDPSEPPAPALDPADEPGILAENALDLVERSLLLG
jgi:hypothetical protein